MKNNFKISKLMVVCILVSIPFVHTFSQIENVTDSLGNENKKTGHRKSFVDVFWDYFHWTEMESLYVKEIYQIKNYYIIRAKNQKKEYVTIISKDTTKIDDPPKSYKDTIKVNHSYNLTLKLITPTVHSSISFTYTLKDCGLSIPANTYMTAELEGLYIKEFSDTTNHPLTFE